MRKPFSEDWGLRNQIERAAVSISSNLAEGFERGSDKAFVSFLNIARGSVAEVRSQLYIAQDFGYISQEECDSAHRRCRTIASAISKLIAYLSEKDHDAAVVREDGVFYDVEER